MCSIIILPPAVILSVHQNTSPERTTSTYSSYHVTFQHLFPFPSAFHSIIPFVDILFNLTRVIFICQVYFRAYIATLYKAKELESSDTHRYYYFLSHNTRRQYITSVIHSKSTPHTITHINKSLSNRYFSEITAVSEMSQTGNKFKEF